MSFDASAAAAALRTACGRHHDLAAQAEVALEVLRCVGLVDAAGLRAICHVLADRADSLARLHLRAMHLAPGKDERNRYQSQRNSYARTSGQLRAIASP